MNEALQAILKFGFTKLELDKIEAYTQTNNENSKNMLLRNKFVLNEKMADEGNPLNSIFELKNRRYEK